MGKRANNEGSVFRRGDTGKFIAQIPVGIKTSKNGKAYQAYKTYTCDTQREAVAKLRAAKRELDQAVRSPSSGRRWRSSSTAGSRTSCAARRRRAPTRATPRSSAFTSSLPSADTS